MSNCTEINVGDIIQLTEPIKETLTEGGVRLTTVVGIKDPFTVKEVAENTVTVEQQYRVNDTTIEMQLRVEKDKINCYVQAEDAPPPPIDPDPPIEPPEEPVCKYNRYSTAMMQNTTKRPEVFLYQGALKHTGVYTGALDGWYGSGSETAVKSFQEDNNLTPVDGIIGKGTATALLKQTGELEEGLDFRIMSLIAFYEVSNARDAFGMAENDISDGAGANYGVFQCNSLGSVEGMLNLAGRGDLVTVYKSSDTSVVNPTIKDWFGSTEGIATQMRYYQEKLLPMAMNEIREFGSFDVWENDPSMKRWWERTILLFVDSIVQNGTMWSPNTRPFWKDLSGSEGRPPEQNIPELYYGTWWDEQLGKHVLYEDYKTKWWAIKAQQDEEHPNDSKQAMKTANRNCAKHLVDDVIPSNDPMSKLLVLGQMRARSSAPTWWYQAVASRRVTDAAGTSEAHPSGVVNGTQLTLPCDYRL